LDAKQIHTAPDSLVKARDISPFYRKESISRTKSISNKTGSHHEKETAYPKTEFPKEMTSTTNTSTTSGTSSIMAAASSGDAVVIPLSTRMALSAFAGVSAATVCHPLDVIRVQMQTGSSYKSTTDAAIQIYKRYGFSGGLYAGISAGYLRQLLYGSCRMGIYSYLLERAKMDHKTGGNISFGSKLLMGCTSGAIGSLVGTPADLALVRMSADSKAPEGQRRGYKNVIDCVVRITREEGLINLWRGATPTVLRCTALSACQLGITSEMKSILVKSGWFGPNGEFMQGIPMLFCATLVSSFFANVAANPFDVVKSRMQNMQIMADGTVMYNSMGDCFIKCVKSEGLMVLYSGFVPAFVKLAPYTVISLTIVDKFTKALTGKDAL
jgi:solute carrier family 25 oxoglutarate transporter 11